MWNKMTTSRSGVSSGCPAWGASGDVVDCMCIRGPDSFVLVWLARKVAKVQGSWWTHKSEQKASELPDTFGNPSKPSTRLFCTSCLFSLNRSNDFPRVFARPEFQIPDPLPSPCCQPAIADGYRHTCPDQCRLDMGRHIIFSLRTVAV